jgi:CRISPR-associated protein Csd2
MSSRKLIVFEHASKLGNAPAYRLFEAVSAHKQCPPEQEPRQFADYQIEIDRDAIPESVSVREYDYIAPSV